MRGSRTFSCCVLVFFLARVSRVADQGLCCIVACLPSADAPEVENVAHSQAYTGKARSSLSVITVLVWASIRVQAIVGTTLTGPSLS